MLKCSLLLGPRQVGSLDLLEVGGGCVEGSQDTRAGPVKLGGGGLRGASPIKGHHDRRQVGKVAYEGLI